MSHRTAILSSFEGYLASEVDSPEVQAEEERERKVRLARFPYSVVLQVAFPELDFANRWCWQRFGPGDGECGQSQSDYPACKIVGPHSHVGKWVWDLLAKTDYNFGFCEWCFSEKSDRDSFLASVDEINWGEKYA
jgi:hypothetical protein